VAVAAERVAVRRRLWKIRGRRHGLGPLLPLTVRRWRGKGARRRGLLIADTYVPGKHEVGAERDEVEMLAERRSRGFDGTGLRRRHGRDLSLREPLSR